MTERQNADTARVAVVTGGASGIGLATVRRLVADGLTVVVLDVTEADTPAAALLRTDITDPADVSVAVARIVDAYGRIDVLVNNAGITGSAEATVCHRTPVEEWDRVMAVNTRGPFLCSRETLPVMLRQGNGHIITIASIAGIVAFPGRCAYSTSKGAALQLTKSLAADYASLGIRANAVCPGFVQTPMTQWRLDIPESHDKLRARIPMGRVAQPDEIADAVGVLASERLSYVTGLALTVDGGWTTV
jgi:NAD(P)-dependent dehydrogenase (short-subunit alcohol dehydrogenase family)